MKGGERKLVERLKRIVEVLVRHEGENPVVLDMSSTPIPTDYFVIVTANSSPHMKALREAVLEELDRLNQPVIFYDKDLEHDWLLIDAGDIVIHIFSEYGREFYDLESLWLMAERLNLIEV
ncbi:MAG: ribosome-associated protein [Thermotogota bacterium]|nr:ribosome-associated protein [Thermotogota bacterium]MDK2864220.1 ribosome-associated protein [Thermotogota bacterium]HCZ05651.1 ribosome silencing factor [Thermotogota bacterium]